LRKAVRAAANGSACGCPVCIGKPAGRSMGPKRRGRKAAASLEEEDDEGSGSEEEEEEEPSLEEADESEEVSSMSSTNSVLGSAGGCKAPATPSVARQWAGRRAARARGTRGGAQGRKRAARPRRAVLGRARALGAEGAQVHEVRRPNTVSRHRKAATSSESS